MSDWKDAFLAKTDNTTPDIDVVQVWIYNSATGNIERVTARHFLPLYALLTSPAFSGNPTAPTQSAGNNSTRLATTAYADLAVAAGVAGLSWKIACRAASTVAGTLASSFANGSTIDGVTLATGDRILIKNQSSGSENGIYIVAASGAPARSTDADSSAELVNASVYVSEGTANADTQWTCTTNAPITVNSTTLTFTQFTAGVGSAASTTEILTGTDTSKTATPDSIAALWEQAADIASSGTMSFGEGGFFHVTGTTTITDIDFAVDKAGRKIWVKFDGALTLTHNATTLILPGGANITTVAGDTACFISEGSDNVRCVAYQRVGGYQPLDSDLTTIAGLTATTDNFIIAVASAWASRTPIQAAVTLQGDGLTSAQVGFRNIPQNSQSTAYTTVAADSGKHILHPAADANARTFTIDSNANVAYPVGTAITFINETSQVVTIAITSDTLVLAGTGTTGSRSLAQYGVATAIKITSTKWYISGTGLT